jgi:sec-independent protein translocase protein TatC
MSEERNTDRGELAEPGRPDSAEPESVTPAGDAEAIGVPESVGEDAVAGEVPESSGSGVEDASDGSEPAVAATDGGSGGQGEDAGSVPPELKAESAPKALDEADKETAQEEAPHEMTFTEHLNELRVRLVRCIVAAFVGLLACYAFAEDLFRILMNPLLVLLEPTGGALIYTGLPEAFFTHLKVAAIAGLFVASPYIFYQLWMFIAPGLYEGERKYMIPIALCSAVCFVTGALFGYFVVFPFGFQFFLGYASDIIKPMPSVREYFSFSTSMLFAFGFIFELPLFMFFLSVLGIVTHVTLRKIRKFAILGSFVVAAILTPPDVVSQCLMAGPLCLLYEIGIWVAYVFGKKPKETGGEEEAEAKA